MAEKLKCLRTLGLQKGASEDEIRKAYKRLALQFHPDKNSSEDANSKFQEISYAYKYLTEPGESRDDPHFREEFMNRTFAEMFFGAQFHHFYGGGFGGGGFYFAPDNDEEYYYSDSSGDEYVYPGSHRWGRRSNSAGSRASTAPQSTSSNTSKKAQRKKEKKQRYKERAKERKREQEQQQRHQQPKPSAQKTYSDPYSSDIRGSATRTQPASDKPRTESTSPQSTPRSQSTDRSATPTQTQSQPTKLNKKMKKKIESDQRKREAEMKEIAEELMKKQEREREKQAEKERKAEEQRKQQEKESFDFPVYVDIGKKSKKAKQRERRRQRANEPISRATPSPASSEGTRDGSQASIPRMQQQQYQTRSPDTKANTQKPKYTASVGSAYVTINKFNLLDEVGTSNDSDTLYSQHPSVPFNNSIRNKGTRHGKSSRPNSGGSGDSCGYKDIGGGVPKASTDYWTSDFTNDVFNNSASQPNSYNSNHSNGKTDRNGHMGKFGKVKSDSVGSFTSDFAKRSFVEDWSKAVDEGEEDFDEEEVEEESKEDYSGEEKSEEDEEESEEDDEVVNEEENKEQNENEVSNEVQNEKRGNKGANLKTDKAGATNYLTTRVFHSRTRKSAQFFVPNDNENDNQNDNKVNKHSSPGRQKGQHQRRGHFSPRGAANGPSQTGKPQPSPANDKPNQNQSSSGPSPKQGLKFGKGGHSIPNDGNEVRDSAKGFNGHFQHRGHFHERNPNQHHFYRPSHDFYTNPRFWHHPPVQPGYPPYFQGQGHPHYQGRPFQHPHNQGRPFHDQRRGHHPPHQFPNSNRPNYRRNQYQSRGDTLDDMDSGGARVASHGPGSRSGAGNSEQAGNQGKGHHSNTGLSKGTKSDSLDSLDDVSSYSDGGNTKSTTDVNKKGDSHGDQQQGRRVDGRFPSHKLTVPAGMFNDNIKNYYK